MIKRFFANKDSTITNAYKLVNVRATGSNMGESDILEVYSLYGNVNTSSSELSRVLVQFPITSSMYSSRINKQIPSSGSCRFYLQLYNAEHGETLPKQYYVQLGRVTKEWVEGTGLDMTNYSDSGSVNWIYAKSGSAWSSQGGDFSILTQSYISNGIENLEFDVTDYVEQYITSSSEYGFMVKLSGSHETESRSYYTKKFFARGSEFFFLRPNIEVRWDDSKFDRRNNCVLSHSALSAQDNLNTIYLYNFVNGQYKDVEGIGTRNIYVSLHQDLSGSSAIALPIGGGVSSPNNFIITGSWVSTGVYSASFAFSSSSISTVYDVWKSADGTIQYFSGSAMTIASFSTEQLYHDAQMNISMPGLKSQYSNNTSQTMRCLIKEKNAYPNIFTVSRTTVNPKYFDNVYYKLSRCSDVKEVIGYGTSSTNHTRLSFDKDGHYFSLDCSMLESGYMYQIQYCLYSTTYFEEFPQVFKFKVI